MVAVVELCFAANIHTRSDALTKGDTQTRAQTQPYAYNNTFRLYQLFLYLLILYIRACDMAGYTYSDIGERENAKSLRLVFIRTRMYAVVDTRCLSNLSEYLCVKLHAGNNQNNVMIRTHTHYHLISNTERMKTFYSTQYCNHHHIVSEGFTR